MYIPHTCTHHTHAHTCIYHTPAQHIHMYIPHTCTYIYIYHTHAEIVKNNYYKRASELIDSDALVGLWLLEDPVGRGRSRQASFREESKFVLSSSPFTGKAILVKSHRTRSWCQEIFLPENAQCCLFSTGHGRGVLPLFPESGCIHAKALPLLLCCANASDSGTLAFGVPRVMFSTEPSA